jgi:hypothetical protein
MLPPEYVITATLKVGVVYKISAPELISTTEPHYFVVVAICGSDNYMLLSTTQLDNKINYLKKRGYHLDTLAYLQPTEDNGLTADSYFNCNDKFTITKQQLIDKVNQDKLSISGNISSSEYDKILYSISLSEVNDIPKFLLKYDKE